MVSCLTVSCYMVSKWCAYDVLLLWQSHKDRHGNFWIVIHKYRLVFILDASKISTFSRTQATRTINFWTHWNSWIVFVRILTPYISDLNATCLQQTWEGDVPQQARSNRNLSSQISNGHHWLIFWYIQLVSTQNNVHMHSHTHKHMYIYTFTSE